MSLSAYNIKVRHHKNGLTEFRVYEKAVRVGNVPKIKERKCVLVDVPFEDEPVKMKNIKDADGFCNPIDNGVLNLQRSVKRTRDCVFDYANATIWEWFCTFTFDANYVDKKGNKLDRSNFEIVSSKMTAWLRNMRLRYCPNMKYVLVPEKHKDGSWHFHGLFADCEGLQFVAAINMQKMYKGKPNKYYGMPLVRNGEQVFDISRFTLGFTDCTRVRDTKKVANYILKYITKDLCCDVRNRKRYWNSKNLEKPSESCFLNELEFYSSVDSLIVECLKKNPNTYCNTFEVQHGDFTNTITYIYC